jgi:hypothetical protein
MGWNKDGNRMREAAEEVLANGGTSEQAQNAAWQAGAHLSLDQLKAAKESIEHDVAKYSRK